MKKIIKVKRLISEISNLAYMHGDWQIHERSEQLKTLFDKETIIVNKGVCDFREAHECLGYVHEELTIRETRIMEASIYYNLKEKNKLDEYLKYIREEMLFDLQEEIEDENN